MLPYIVYYKDRKYIREEPVITPPTPFFKRRVLHDWERSDWKGYVWRAGMPEVFRCGQLQNSDNHHFVELTKEWQFFWMDIASKVYYGKYSWELTRTQFTWLASRITAVGSNNRAFTNNHGLDVFRNYLLDSNRNASTNPAIATIVCGGHCFTEKKIVINEDGEEMLEVPSFDGRKSPPDVTKIDVKNDPRIFIANSITATKVPTGGYAVNPFPQLEVGSYKTDVPVILVSYFPIFFPKKYTQEINATSKANPYNAPRPFFQKYPSIAMNF